MVSFIVFISHLLIFVSSTNIESNDTFWSDFVTILKTKFTSDEERGDYVIEQLTNPKSNSNDWKLRHVIGRLVEGTICTYSTVSLAICSAYFGDYIYT